MSALINKITADANANELLIVFRASISGRLLLAVPTNFCRDDMSLG